MVWSEPVDVDATSASFADGLRFGKTPHGPEDDVSARTIASDLRAFSDKKPDGIEQDGSSAGVSAANPAKISLVEAAGDEFGKSLLFQSRSMPVAQPFGCGKRLD